MKSNRNAIRFTVTTIVSVCLFLSSCTLKTTAALPSTTSAATLVPSAASIPTLTLGLSRKVPGSLFFFKES